MKNLFAVVLGLTVGLGLGLLYSWVIDPVEYTGTALHTLRADYQLQYAALVAQTYAVDGDVARAQARLAPWGNDAAQTMAAFAQRAAAANVDPNIVQAMSALAGALGAGPSGPTAEPPTLTPASSPLPASPSPEPTSTPAPTATPTITPTPTNTPRLLPTRTPSPTPLGAFVFVSQESICDPTLAEPLLQVITLDAVENPLPGVVVGVEWAGGFDRFFTGLKPERGLGYGDFTMQPDTDYTLRLLDSPSAFVTGLRAEPCFTTNGQTYPGSWLVVFQQP